MQRSHQGSKIHTLDVTLVNRHIAVRAVHVRVAKVSHRKVRSIIESQTLPKAIAPTVTLTYHTILMTIDAKDQEAINPTRSDILKVA